MLTVDDIYVDTLDERLDLSGAVVVRNRLLCRFSRCLRDRCRLDLVLSRCDDERVRNAASVECHREGVCHALLKLCIEVFAALAVDLRSDCLAARIFEAAVDCVFGLGEREVLDLESVCAVSCRCVCVGIYLIVVLDAVFDVFLACDIDYGLRSPYAERVVAVFVVVLDLDRVLGAFGEVYGEAVTICDDAVDNGFTLGVTDGESCVLVFALAEAAELESVFAVYACRICVDILLLLILDAVVDLIIRRNILC